MDKQNPLGISNSELAQVQAHQKVINDIFNDKFKHLEHRRDFYTNIYTVTRFCIAREFKKDKIIEMWVKWVEWYEEYKPDQIKESEEIISKIHSSGKYRYCGVDKFGCPVLVIRMKFHVKGLATAEENLRYLLFMIEKGVALARQAKTYQLSIIYDRRDMAESDDVSKQSMKKFMPMLNDYYPETLKSFYVLGANLLYRGMWKIVSVFIAKRTEEKINLLEEPEKITDYITKNNLPIEYGGQCKI